MTEQRVAIVGAGVAGLHCASILLENGFEVVIFDRENEIGGRMRTKIVDGFQLDRGFHVMQTAYPTAKNVFDHKAMGSRSFDPGALIVDSRKGKQRIRRMADPWRQPVRGILSGFNGFAGVGDLLKVARLRSTVTRGTIDSQFNGEDDTTMEYLRTFGFSQGMIDRFFLPLFSGIFLESDLRTSERMFRFVFRMMSKGRMVLPRDGIGAAPSALAKNIGDERMRLGVRIGSLDSDAVRFRGEAHRFDAVVKAFSEIPENTPTRSVWTVHYDAEKAPFKSKLILLNGDIADPNSLVAHVAVPSNIQPTYAPDGRSLVTVTIVGDRAVAAGIQDPSGVDSGARADLGRWFGDGTVSGWRTLDIQNIEMALPETGAGVRLTHKPRSGPGDVIECGDQLLHGSVEGALLSAEKAADEVMNQLRHPTGVDERPMRRF